MLNATVLILSIIISLVTGKLLIPFLHKLKFGQPINTLGPSSHMVKQGVPTMGGLILLLSTVLPLSPFIFSSHAQLLHILLVSGVLFALIGFMDDYVKVTQKRSLGLTARQKLYLQVFISLAISYWITRTETLESALYVPFVNKSFKLGLYYLPIITFILVATTNSSNLLDGLDGLLSSCSIVMFVFYAVICFLLSINRAHFMMPVDASISFEYEAQIKNVLLAIFALIGSCIGFLFFNKHPARIIMGDTGSMFLGVCVTILAVVTKTTLLLPLIAFTMFISSLSVIIQVTYFKKTKGKRIFRMSPIHHHFELGGMSEVRIVKMYVFVQIVLCVVAAGIVLFVIM